MKRQVPSNGMTRPLLTAAAIALVGLVSAGLAPRAGAASRAEDQTLRADTIVQMLRFVEWTDQAHGRELTVAVVGNLDLADALRDACASLQPGGRPVLVVDVASPRAAADTRADVVVLGAMPQTDARVVAAQLASRGMLTVGDGDFPDTAHLALNLFADGARYRFQANPAAAARAGANLSSRLLRLAQIVN
jgi:hypothetical protein